jgi:hypothetical protein
LAPVERPEDEDEIEDGLGVLETAVDGGEDDVDIEAVADDLGVVEIIAVAPSSYGQVSIFKVKLTSS